MDQKEVQQKERLKEFDKYIKTLDLTKYGYIFDYGPVTQWCGDASGNVNTYVWKQTVGHFNFEISVFTRFERIDGDPGCDYMSASIVDTRKENSIMILNYFEDDKKHALNQNGHNWENKPIEEYTTEYFKILTEALDTYLNDFIMGRKYEETKVDRGDY